MNCQETLSGELGRPGTASTALRDEALQGMSRGFRDEQELLREGIAGTEAQRQESPGTHHRPSPRLQDGEAGEHGRKQSLGLRPRFMEEPGLLAECQVGSRISSSNRHEICCGWWQWSDFCGQEGRRGPLPLLHWAEHQAQLRLWPFGFHF